eukprot:TRINITY_DN9958_c0_g1_i1.p1 TRINITY_DN9958_c0_g1~~TRINITY_DN9958_c0_g1_i1.p1  ORF type:complete len:422 (+),score=71.65 TRINITY_DN9958_c0_g1_i1:116-1381(+)
MTTWWSSGERHWCRYCKLYIAGTPGAIRQHEAGRKHKELEALFIRDQYRKSSKDTTKEEATRAELARIDREAQAAYLARDISDQTVRDEMRLRMLQEQRQREQVWREVSSGASTAYVNLNTGAEQSERPGGTAVVIKATGLPDEDVEPQVPRAYTHATPAAAPAGGEPKGSATQAPSGMNRKERRALKHALAAGLVAGPPAAASTTSQSVGAAAAAPGPPPRPAVPRPLQAAASPPPRVGIDSFIAQRKARAAEPGGPAAADSGSRAAGPLSEPQVTYAASRLEVSFGSEGAGQGWATTSVEVRQEDSGSSSEGADPSRRARRVVPGLAPDEDDEGGAHSFRALAKRPASAESAAPPPRRRRRFDDAPAARAAVDADSEEEREDRRTLELRRQQEGGGVTFTKRALVGGRPRQFRRKEAPP